MQNYLFVYQISHVNNKDKLQNYWNDSISAMAVRMRTNSNTCLSGIVVQTQVRMQHAEKWHISQPFIWFTTAHSSCNSAQIGLNACDFCAASITKWNRNK